MKKKYIKNIIYNENEKVSKIIKVMDDFIVLVNSKKIVTGVFTEGDFRKAVLKGIKVNQKIFRIMNKKFKYVNFGTNYNKKLEKIFKNKLIQNVLVLKKGKFLSLINKNEYLKIKYGLNTKKNNPIIIIAGGKGKRMHPFTQIIPKGLMPIGGEPVIKKIINEFLKYNYNNFHLIINYKSKFFQGYFHENFENYKIRFHLEKKPLGTAGYLANFKEISNEPVFVTNCDVLLKINYNEVLEFHKRKKNDLTICATFKNFMVPYGIFQTDKKSNMLSIKEKPEYNLLVNSGFYVFNPKIFKHIKKNEYLDMNYLIDKLKKLNKKISIFPIPNNAWFDIGQIPEYKKTLELLGKKNYL